MLIRKFGSDFLTLLNSIMLEDYKILTITHRQTNVKQIGSFVIPHSDTKQLQEKLQTIKAQFQLEELMYVATCNRVMYFFKTTTCLNASFQYKFFQTINPVLNAAQISENLQAFEGETALRHLFEVTASVDSMVVGEREILRQIRESYEQSQQFGLTGDSIRLAINHAVQTAKAVYSNTRIGEKPVSIVSLAIQQFRSANLPKDARILLVGAGQTNTLVGKFLKKYDYANIHVFNRTLARAEQLAIALDGQAYSLEDLSNYTAGFDCLIVCTGATQAVITPELYNQLLQGETDKKFVIDLSIPNNVAKRVVHKNAMQYVEIEGLRLLAKENLAFRSEEVQRAKRLVTNTLEEFPKLYQQRQLALAMRAVPTEIKAIKDHAMNNVFKKEVDELDEDTRLLLDRMLTYMEKKCISIPMKAVKEATL